MRGTVFNDLDDDKLAGVIDFGDFEEHFKIGTSLLPNGGVDTTDGLSTLGSRRAKKPEKTSLLEHTRLRNIGQSAGGFRVGEGLRREIMLRLRLLVLLKMKGLDRIGWCSPDKFMTGILPVS